MPVNVPHKEYSENYSSWQRIRTVLDGQDEMKKQADTYVPRPRGFENKPLLWLEYIKRGEFYNASARTVTGLLGAMFRRSPVVNIPSVYDHWKRSITQDGLSVEGFCKLTSKELLELGRFGILVDMPQEGAVGVKARPYLAGYCAEKIINWQMRSIPDPDNPGEFTILPSLVVLKECICEIDKLDPFKTEEIEQYRALSLGLDGFYCVDIYRKTDPKDPTSFARFGPTVEPKGPNGQRLTFIPFIFVSPENITCDIERSPIEDLCLVNISHFITAIDLEWSCHLTACPQIVVTGWDDDKKELAVGSAVVWTFQSDLVRASILEYKGEGIAALERRCAAKEDKMAKLGANLLRAKNKQPETAETTRIEHSAESSILSMIAKNSGAAVTKALNWALWWQTGVVESATVEQNTEFYDNRLTYQELSALTASLQAGALPVSAFAFNLLRGDMVPSGTSQADLEAEIQKSLKAAAPPAPMPSNPGGNLPGLPPKAKQPLDPLPSKEDPGMPAP